MRDLILKYLYSSTKAEQDVYAELLEKVDFFEYIHDLGK